MTVLISGGAASGKSAFAERLAVRLARQGGRPPLYIAAMEPYGDEAAVRIAKHREQRRGLGFVTVERYRDLAGLDLSGDTAAPDSTTAPDSAVLRDCTVLLEDLGNLCANELFAPEQGKADTLYSPRDEKDGKDSTADRAECAVLSGLERLRASCRHVVVVTNEVFRGGAAYAGDTDAWLRLLAAVNRKTASLSDGVCEVVCGVPCWYKDPWGRETTFPCLRRL